MPTSTPMHGKLGALYVLRPNGFNGVGLNDLAWAFGSTAADLTVYVVTIDANAPDTYAWTVNGGGGAAGVAFLGGVEETLADAQKLTFAAQLGHTITDTWTIGNLKDEPTTVNGSTAQITDATARLLNPNLPPVWTPTNAVTLLSVDYTKGIATFSAAPGVTTVTGNGGFIPSAALKKVGYLIDWNLNITLDMADASRMGQLWKESLPGLAGASGVANGYFVANQTLLNCLQASIAAGDKYFLLQLFTYDPDQDQTGDHYNVWVTFTGWQTGATINEVVKESVNFQVFGMMSSIVDNV